MLSSVLPWEWILENVLDLKEFSSPCLKELMSYIPHIEDARCSKLLQKVALRYLEEIVLTRKVDSCAITLIKYILKAQGGSSLRRIHSLKESVENDLILRVETEVVLATVRYPGSGGRNWKALEDAVEEVFPEVSRETFKLERRKELMSILLVDEHQDDLCQRMLRKYPLEELLKDLLQFIVSKRTLLKTKFLDQLAKDVEKGSYVPSSASPSSEDRLSSPTHVSKDSYCNLEVSEILLRRDKADLPYSLQAEPTLPNTLLGEPIEKLTAVMKETSADMHNSRSSPSSPISLVDGGQTTMHEVKEQRDRNIGEDQSTGADKVPMQEDLEADMSPSMTEVDKVAQELTSQMDEFVDNMDKFAADIHKVAVNSTDQSFGFVNTVVSQQEQRVDPTSFLAEFAVASKRPASDKLTGSTRKSKRGSLYNNPGPGRDFDGFPAKAGFPIRDDNNTGRAVGETIRVKYSASGDGLDIPNETPLFRLFKNFLRQSTQEQSVRRPSASTGTVLKHISSGHDTCALCRRGGVLLRCHECSVLVHERCLDEIGMGKAVNEPYWSCPSCVEQLTMEVLEGLKAEAEIARQNAAVFVHARGKHCGGRRSSSESVDGQDGLGSNEGQAAEVGCSANKQNLPASGEHTPAEDPHCNIPVPVVEEGDGHDGDLEEDIHRHQDEVESSKADQTSDHPSPVGERTPPRKGRYRGRWKIPGVRRKNLPWSESEVAVLREGVKKYSSSGFGFRWKNILEFGHGAFDPSRTTIDLKDKWRNLNKVQDRSSSSDVSV